MRLHRSDLELEVLYNRIEREELDLQPDFQRGEVWDRMRQQRLIDTILRRWYVPAIHIVREESTQNELVLDGQQRLSTIRKFFKNQLRVAGLLEPRDEELARLDGLHFKDLPAEYKKRFQRFEITVITLTDYKPSEPSELFFRLNQQYALTPPEKRNALYGKARDQVKDVVATLISKGALSRERVGFTNGRLAYDDVFARLCITLKDRSLRRQISNSYVEEFYRHDSFDENVITQTKVAGERLGAALGLIERIRFNKATLFSWLVFVHANRFEDIARLSSFIHDFEVIRNGAPGSSSDSKPLNDYIRIYSDRASYRVLDVNSVLLRDLVLHIAHAAFVKPLPLEARLIPLLDRTFEAGEAEQVLLQFIDDSGWGTLE